MPEKLRMLNLAQNKISQRNLYYGDLPPRISVIALYGNRIAIIEPIDEHTALPNLRTFNAGETKIVARSGEKGSATTLKKVG